MEPEWERLRAPEFWQWLFEDFVAFDDEESFELVLQAGDGHGLKVQIEEGTSITLLDLETGTELGWSDCSNAHPNCLRAEEALHVASAQRLPEKQSLATLLLLLFVVVVDDDAAKKLRGAVGRAWAVLGFEGSCAGLHLLEFDEQQVEWQLGADGRWCLRSLTDDVHARPLYTLRVESNADFPAWLSRVESRRFELPKGDRKVFTGVRKLLRERGSSCWRANDR